MKRLKNSEGEAKKKTEKINANPKVYAVSPFL